jgi:hypothetical protein
MKPEMRQQLAQLPFEEKIRNFAELIRLSRKIKAQRVFEDAQTCTQPDIRSPKSI